MMPPEVLQENLLLRDLSRDELALLAQQVVEARYEPGALVLIEGEPSDSVHLVISGEARVTRGQTTLFRVQPGEFFGELGLLTLEPRAATVVAETSLVTGRLERATLDSLMDSHPHLTARLIRQVARRLRQLLGDVTDALMLLIEDGGRPRRAEIAVVLEDGHRIGVKVGTLVQSLLPATVDGERVVAALVDGKSVALASPLFAPGTVTPLLSGSLEGRRVYRRSVGLLLLEAAHRLDPGLGACIGPSLGFAHLVELGAWGGRRPVEMAAELLDGMRRLAAHGTALRRERWTVEEARAQFLTQGWDDAARLLRTARSPSVPLVSFGHVYAFEEGPFVPSADFLDNFELVVENDDLLLYFGDYERRSSGLVRATHPGRLAREHEQWLRALGAISVGHYNELCVGGRVGDMIRVSEGFHEKRVGQLADTIAEGDQPPRVVCISGPSSAGKTTFIRRLSVQLEVDGVRPHPLSLDDYYVDREKTVRDEHGEFDFEAFEALDYDLLADHLARLARGEAVTTAHYDFKTGASEPTGGPVLQLGPRDVLLLEGIHGLNPRLPIANGERVFRLFVNPMTSIPLDHVSRVSVSDVRLLRRIVRDRRRRGIDAASNIARWGSVRRGEERHIFPYQDRADAVFNTSLIYELSVLKVYAERYLLEVPESHPSYTTAFRLRRVIDRFVAIYPDHVPPTSLIREFIGGSSFER